MPEERKVEGTMPDPAQEQITQTAAWKIHRQKFIRWGLVYVVVWATGAALVIPGILRDEQTMSLLTLLGLVPFWGSSIPYAVSIVHAYRMLRDLNQLGVYKPAAWRIVVAAVILNPWTCGWILLAGVLITASICAKKVSAVATTTAGS